MIPKNDTQIIKPMDESAKKFLTTLSILFVFGLTLSIFSFVFFQPLNNLAAIVKIVFYSMPFTFGLYFILKNIVVEKLQSFSRPEVVRIYFLASTLLYPVSILNYLNARLDKSIAKNFEVVVIEKYIKHGDNNVGYYVQFFSPMGASCCFLPDESDSIHISKNEFEQVIPNQTKVQLQIRDGFLGLPWLDNYAFKLNGVSLRNQEKESAMNWAGETIQTNITELREFKWPNGKIKSAEPIFEGQIQGLAKYWHPNGQLYAEIPFKAGKKHGRFKLFRENGILDQELSYKNGELYGLCRWYDDNGNLKQEALYINGQLSY